MNVQVVEVIQDSADIIHWTIQDIKRNNKQTQKIMAMNGEIHPRSKVLRLHSKRCEGGRALISMKECVLAEMKSLCEYISK